MAEFESLKNDDGLKREIEFETKLRDLLGEFSYSLENVVNILDPHFVTRQVPASTDGNNSRRARVVKLYKNPHSGEVVETKGGNHSVLKQWKAEYGAEDVESWLAQ